MKRNAYSTRKYLGSVRVRCSMFITFCYSLYYGILFDSFSSVQPRLLDGWTEVVVGLWALCWTYNYSMWPDKWKKFNICIYFVRISCDHSIVGLSHTDEVIDVHCFGGLLRVDSGYSYRADLIISHTDPICHSVKSSWSPYTTSVGRCVRDVTTKQ